MEQCLLRILTQVLADPNPHPLLAGVCCNYVKAYGFIIARHPAHIQDCMRFLLACGVLTDRAGEAFVGLCRDTRAVLSGNTAALEAVVQAVHGDRRLADMPIANRRKYVGGLAHLVSGLKDQPDVAAQSLTAILAPVAHSLQTLLTAQATADGAQVAEEQLSLVAALFEENAATNQPRRPMQRRRLRPGLEKKRAPTPEGPPPPALRALQCCWELVCACVGHWPGHERVAAAAMLVFEAVLTCLVEQALPLLASIANTAINAFHTAHSPAALEVLSRTVQLFGERPDAAASFQGVLQAVFAAMPSPEGEVEPDPAVMEHFFDLCSDLALSCPTALLPALEAAVTHAHACLARSQSRGPLRTAIDFLRVAVEWRATDPAEMEHAMRCTLGRAAELVRLLMHGVAGDSFPRDLSAKVGGLLHAMVKAAPADHCRRCFVEALAHSAFPSQHLGVVEKERVVEIILRLRDLPEGKFRAFLQDFSALCRAQNSADCLLAYQLT
jgi:hypothetical protein